MIRIFAFLLFFTLSFHSFSQDFQPGFIVKLSKDSVFGFVASGSKKANSKVCFFKTDKASKITKYLPTELTGYGFKKDKYYEAKKIVVDQKGQNKKREVFLEVLVKGNASLYKYYDKFYLERDSIYLLPKNIDEEVVIKNQIYSKSSNKYVGVLNSVLFGCNLKADTVKYEEHSLAVFVQKYNQCKGAQSQIFKIKKEWKPNPGLLVMIDQANIELGSGYNNYAMRESVSTSIGGTIDLVKSISLDVFYIKKIFQGYSEFVSPYSPGLNRNDLHLHASFLKMSISYRHNLWRGNPPYLNFGLTFYGVLNSSIRIVTETENNGVVKTTVNNSFLLLKEVTVETKNQTGVWIGFGYLKRINSRFSGLAEVRFEKNNGFTTSPSSGSALSFLFGIKF